MIKAKTLKDIFKARSPEYLIDEILYKNTLVLLSAYAGVGKTVLSLSIAKALLTGKALWKTFEVQETGPVIIFDEENPLSFVKDRVIKMGFKKDLPLYYVHYQNIKLDKEEHFNAIVKLINEIDPKLIIFDSLIRFYDGDENSSNSMAYVMGKIRELTTVTDCTAIVIHHDRKSYGEKKERVRGSGDIVGAVDIQLALEEKDGIHTLSNGKTRVIRMAPLNLKLKITDTKMEFIYLGRA